MARDSDSRADRRIKIYVMATQCAGKTTFCQRYPVYRGLRMVDFSQVNRSAIREPKGTAAGLARGSGYHARLRYFLRRQKGPIAVLGRRSRAPRRVKGVILTAVLIPEDDHRRQSRARARAKPKSRWGDFSRLVVKRRRLARYAAAKGIPVFDSFDRAIDWALEQPS